VKGDFTRETFRARRHYWGVLRQQGRVDIDADWNEQVEIRRHHELVRTEDLIGPSGGPLTTAGFELSVRSDGNLDIGAGRYYVAGILCENDQTTRLDLQPDAPDQELPDAAGLHLAYLDVWDRHVTALDDPLIREVALGGPDTATRARTVWQLLTQPLPAGDQAALDAAIAALVAARAASDELAEAAALQSLRDIATAAACDSPLPPVDGSLAPGTGTMAARSQEGADVSDPCRFDPGGGGYTRLENRLYRVEIHDPGDDSGDEDDGATFKWSRDNGSFVVSVEQFRTTGTNTTTDEIVVRRLGLDQTQMLNRDDWIEIVSDDLIARGEPGQLVQIREQPDPADRRLLLRTAIDAKAAELHPQVRKWDLPVGGLARVRKSAQLLEAGIEVEFGVGQYHTGDYWIIPARANTADVEWTPFPEYPGQPTGAAEFLPPRGIARWRAPIAALVLDGDGVVATIDLRRLFPAATDLVDFAYAGGDGQTPELPDGAVPQPLQTSVTNGAGAVAGVIVEYQIVDANGDPATTSTLTGAGQTGNRVVVPTDARGLASVEWEVDPNVVDHRVRAQLLDDCAIATRAPIFFSSRVNFQLHYLSGDGQEGMPGEQVQPLRAWVSDGRHPVQNAVVLFTAAAGNGTIVAPGPTGPDGTVECAWTLDALTPRQQVTAQLVDAAGNPIHDAALVFMANLSLASRVAYTPVADCLDLAGTTTVQEALDELCRREGGGDCTYTIRAGEDLVARFEAIIASGFRDGAICFVEGEWRIDRPIVLPELGHVTIRGLGPATTVVADTSESCFRFENCLSVTVTDLAVVAGAARGGDGLGGAVSAVDCGPVTIERVTAVTAHGPEPRVSGIAVTRGDRSQSRGPIRIRDCNLATGEQQTGILVVNSDSVEITGNSLEQWPFPEGTRLEEYLENARYRAAARERLVDPRPDATLDPGTGSVPEVVTGEVIAFEVGAEGSRQPVTFHSGMGSRDVWASIVATEASTSREALATAYRVADTVLRNAGAYGERRVFRTWFEEIRSRWQAAGSRAIVVGGRRATDVRIVDNVIAGHLQGISVALSADTREVYRTGVALIEGNTVRLPDWSLVKSYTEGIFLGNTQSSLVDGNAVFVGEPGQVKERLVADGIRAGGVFGPRLQIRSNHFERTVAGVRVEPVRPMTRTRRWVASDNIAADGFCLVAPCEIVEDSNVPQRQGIPGEPGACCPLDRPADWARGC
jgi:hypothetical protein